MNGFVVVPRSVGQMTPNSENGHCSFISFDHSQSAGVPKVSRSVGQLMIYGGNTRNGWLSQLACLFTSKSCRAVACRASLPLVHLRDQNLLGKLGWKWKGKGPFAVWSDLVMCSVVRRFFGWYVCLMAYTYNCQIVSSDTTSLTPTKTEDKPILNRTETRNRTPL